jgi:hypothetical protein
MVHDSEAGGSRRQRKVSRPRNLIIEEASMLYEENLLVPLDWRMPGQDLLELIDERRNTLFMGGDNVDPMVFTSNAWAQHLRAERDARLARPSNPYGGRWNKDDLHGHWDLLDVEEELLFLAAERRHRSRPPRRPINFGAVTTAEGVPPPLPEPKRERDDNTDFEALIAAEVMPPDLSEEEVLEAALRASEEQAVREEEAHWAGTFQVL